MSGDALDEAWRDVVTASLDADAEAESRALAELRRHLPTQREPSDFLASEVATLRGAVEHATACLRTSRFDEALDVLLAAEAPARRWWQR